MPGALDKRTRRKLSSMKTVLVALSVLIVLLQPLHLAFPGVDPIRTFEFSDSKALAGLFRNLLVRNQQLVIHVAKECHPVVSFGGLGQVVGAISAGAAEFKNTSVAVILPKYGFVARTVKLVSFEFRLASGTIRGSVHSSYVGGVLYFFVGAPSHMSKLWRSKKIEDTYKVPSTWIRKFTAADRDLYFSFVAAHIIYMLSTRASLGVPGGRLVAHVHGATNVPTTWFLRRLDPTISSIYTVHDYNAEPWISWHVKRTARYAQTAFNVFNGRLNIFFCDELRPGKRRPLSMKYKQKISSAEFAYCADVITTVSKGMIQNIMHENEPYARLFISFLSQSRLTNVNNWVQESVWNEARQLVSLNNPVVGKRQAKTRLLYDRKFVPFQPRGDIGDSCVVLWLGRFEWNKGVGFLPDILRAACAGNCILVISGYSTNDVTLKLFKKVQKELNRVSARLHCPYISFHDRKSQLLNNQLVRAAADIVVISSQNEAFGLVAVESLAYGAIPVVSAVGGLRETINPFVAYPTHPENNWTGFEFPLFAGNSQLTAWAIKVTLGTAVSALRSLRDARQINPMCRRLISSTPLAHDGLQSYNQLVLSLLASPVRSSS